MQYPSFNSQFPVQVLPATTLWEWPYLSAILNQIPASILKAYRWIVTDHHTPLPDPDGSTVVFFLSNEDGRLPDYAEKVKAVFTPYPPTLPTSNSYIIPLGPGIMTGMEPPRLPHVRKYDLFFSGRKLQRRQAAFNALDALAQDTRFRVKIRKNSAFGKGFGPKEYLNLLADSKMALAPEGNFSNVTFRHFEALLKGCVVISGPLPDIGPYASFPAFQVEEWHTIPALFERLLKQPEELENALSQGLQYYQQVIAPSAVANFVSKALAH